MDTLPRRVDQTEGGKACRERYFFRQSDASHRVVLPGAQATHRFCPENGQ